MAVAPRPGRAAIGLQPRITGLGVERDDADAAQVGQFARGSPSVHCGVSLIEIADEALYRWDGLGKTERSC
jgi:hypothetical protein